MLLLQKQVKEQFNISYPTLHKWVKEGLLTEYRTPGGHRRYDKEEIEKTLRIIKV